MLGQALTCSKNNTERWILHISDLLVNKEERHIIFLVK